MDDRTKEAVLAPVREWALEIGKEKNADGAHHKKTSYSRAPRKLDEETYLVSAHVNTAETTRQLTQHYRLTIKRKPGTKAWEIAEKELVDDLTGLFRESGVSCFPFERFSFDREGLVLSASNGSMCEEYLEGRVSWFGIHSDDLGYEYAPPPYAQLVPTAHDFYAMHDLFQVDHRSELVFDPAAFFINCHVDSCEELIAASLTGAQRPTADQRSSYGYDAEAVAPWLKRLTEKTIKERKEDAFTDFSIFPYPGNKRWSVFIPRELTDADDGIWLAYDNWDGWEVRFGVRPQRWDVPNQLVGAVYGYYSEETTNAAEPYELERRENQQTRWFEVFSVKGDVELAILDPETVHGNVEFGLNLKQDMETLPFFIISFSTRGLTGGDRPKPIVVNAIEVDGKQATWVQYGPLAGAVILPEPMQAGSQVKVRMDWQSRALLKFTHSYSYMPRGGWLPFVRFGDVIDEFELTIRSPAKYDVIGLGHKIEEHVEDTVRVSHWRSDSPCNFPTIIFGKYQSDVPKFDAKKLDGTVIPVTVHVDEASFGSWQIRTNALRPIAEQAANSINLFAAVSGLDYPFGELNLVNDPRGFLYGQAPSSVIYLGSGVFKGEGSLAPYFANAAGISTFLRSVVAHEVGHQWWGNRIANANDRNYWFVESLAEYFSALYLEHAFGWKDYTTQVEDWRRAIFASNLKSSVQNASTLFAGEWGGGRGGSSYQAAVYNKGPYAFHMLRELFKGAGPRGAGAADERFYAFLKKFSMDLADKREIVTLDIQRAAEAALGGVDAEGNPYTLDLGWFFDQWIRGSGMPQYAFEYDVRQAEDGTYLIEGLIRQRVLLGKTDHVMQGTTYRGVVYVTVKAKGGPYQSRVVIDDTETPVRLKVPEKPLEVTLNEDGEMLAHETLYNRSW